MMGLVFCDKHGRQGVENVSENLWRAHATKALASEQIKEFSFSFDGIEFPFLGLDKDIIDIDAEYAGGVFFPKNEESLERLIGALRPICLACLNSYKRL